MQREGIECIQLRGGNEIEMLAVYGVLRREKKTNDEGGWIHGWLPDENRTRHGIIDRSGQLMTENGMAEKCSFGGSVIRAFSGNFCIYGRR